MQEGQSPMVLNSVRFFWENAIHLTQMEVNPDLQNKLLRQYISINTMENVT